VLVVEGLKAGERIVIEGVQKVRNGTPVTPVTAEQLAASAAATAKTGGAKPSAEGAAKANPATKE
jgi:membrane fusion protein (multidrug efflux system)